MGEKRYSCIFLTSAPDGGGWSTTLPHRFTRGKETQYPLFVFQEAGWASGPVWTGAVSLASAGIQCPDRPGRYTIPVFNKTRNTGNYVRDSLVVCTLDEIEVLLRPLKEYGLVTRGMQGRDDTCSKNLNGIPHGDRREAFCEGGDGMHRATEFDEWMRCLQ